MATSNHIKLGSLFDGSGGFPLAASMCGIEPVWASEVEPYPIAVTKSRFPNMKHLGSVTDVNGAEVEPVDIITFGSPCQDLSVAGKRAGLKHEANGDNETTRSGLFIEAVRIIKEMREATNGEYPTFALWENVPGAFSSNKGEDFRTVLEELIKIVEPKAVMPAVPPSGWAYADSYVGNGWSLAYRVFDAQYWGVPQRRRRIHLVVDFRGERAGEVLFEREGVRGYFATGGTPWQRAAGDAADCAGADDCEGEGNCLTPWDVQSRRIFSVDGPWPALYGGEGGGHGYAFVPYLLKIRSGCEGGGKGALIQEDKSATLAGGIGWQEECAATLAAQSSGTEPTVCIKKAYSIENHPADSRVDIDDSGKVQTLTSRMGTGGGNVPMVLEYHPVYCLQGNGIDRADTAGCNGKGWKEDTSYTLNTIDRPAVAYSTDVGFFNTLEERAPTLLARGYKDPHLVTYWDGTQTVGMLTANNAGGSQRMPDKDNFNCIVDCVRYIVRRLTPTECARLQGFADGWGDIDTKDSFTPEEYRFWLDVRNTHAAINGKVVKEYTEHQMLTWYNKLHTDSAEYKMWGNGIALPPALYCMQGIASALMEQELGGNQ